jgi:uncharacterized integral membrane protein
MIAKVTAVVRLGSYAIPAFVVFLIWIVVVVLVIILLAWIVHQTGGGELTLKLGHFHLEVGVT